MFELLRALFDESPASIVVRDLDGRHLYANRRAQQHARANDRLEGRTLADVYGDERAAELLSIQQEVLTSGRPLVSEGEFLVPEGGTRPMVIVRHRAVSPESGEPVVIGIGTERTDVRAEPDEQALRFRQLVDSIEDVFVLSSLDPTGNLYVSPNVADLFGIDPEALRGDTLLTVVHPDDRAGLAAALASITPENRNIEVEYRITGPDGVLRWFRARTRVVRGPAGDARMATIINDISNDRRLHEEVARARDEAQAANAHKNDFLSQMSHELRTPLNAILGFTQLLELEDPAEHQLDSLVQIRRAGQHLLDLINEILDLERIERGVLALSIEHVEIATVLSEAVELRPSSKTRSVSLEVRPPDVRAVAVADRQRLLQVLLNIIGNGIKYNREGGTVEVGWRSTDEGTVRIAICDDGPGLNEREIERLFTPFDRLGRTDEIEGTGIGLGLCRRLVEAMSGAITVESAVGRGTTFTIELPHR